MKTISIYGNCQSIALAMMMKASSDFRSRFQYIRTEPVQAVSLVEHRRFLEEVVPQLDVIVYQPIRADFRGSELFGSKYVIDRLSKEAQAVSFPSLQFYGYHPLTVLFAQVTKEVAVSSRELFGLSGNELFHFASIVNAFLDGNSVAEALEVFDKGNDILTDHAHKGMLVSLQHMQDSEVNNNIDIGVSSYIQENYTGSMLFHTPRHPSKEVLAYVCQKIFAKLGVNSQNDELLRVDPLGHLLPFHSNFGHFTALPRGSL